MADIGALYGKRFTNYPSANEVKKVADVNERDYAIFLMLLPPDSYSVSGQIQHETRQLFSKASAEVVTKIVRKFVFNSDLWEPVRLTNEDYGKRFHKFMLTEKGKQEYSKRYINPSLADLERDSLSYWLNDYVEKDIIRGVDNLLPEYRQYVKRGLGSLQKDYLEGKLIEGRKIEIIMPNGEKRKSEFAIVDLDNIKASHNEDNFESTEGYPTDQSGYNINDRNYKGDQNAQNAVIQYAQNLEPERLITTSRTPSGTPIITKDGIVVSGNNRVMSLKRAAKYHPDRYDAYKKFLLEEAEAFGIPNSSVTAILMNESVPLEGSSFHNPKSVRIIKPVLVRIDYDFPEYTTAELAKYNKDTKKSERPIDAVIKLSNIFRSNKQCAEAIASQVGEFENMSDFKKNLHAQKKVFEFMEQCNVVTEQERAKYFDDHGFTEQGIYLLEMLLSAIVLDREALMVAEKEGVKSFRNAIVTSLPALMKNASLTEGSLIKDINDAVILQFKIMSSALSFKDYISQLNILDEKPQRKTLIMNRMIDAGRNNFRQAIDKYNEAVMQSQGESLFGEKPTIDEMFTAYIEKRVEEKNPNDLKVINNLYADEAKPNRLTSDQLKKLHPEFAAWFEKEYPNHKDAYKMNTFEAGDLFIYVPETAIHIKEVDMLAAEKDKKIRLAKAKANAQKQKIGIIKLAKMEEGGYLHGSRFNFCDTGFTLKNIGKGQGQNIYGTGVYLTPDKTLANYYAKYVLDKDERKTIEDKIAKRAGFEKYEDIPHDFEIPKYKPKWGKHHRYDMMEEETKKFVEQQKERGVIYEATLFKGKDESQYKILDLSGTQKEDWEKAQKDISNLYNVLTKNKKKYTDQMRKAFEELGLVFDPKEYEDTYAATMHRIKMARENFHSFDSSYTAGLNNALFNCDYYLRKPFEVDLWRAKGFDFDKMRAEGKLEDIRKRAARMGEQMLANFFQEAGYKAVIYSREFDIQPSKKDGDEYWAKAIVVFDPDDITLEKCNLEGGSKPVNPKAEVQAVENEKEKKIRLAKAKANAQKQKIEILKLEKMDSGGSLVHYGNFPNYNLTMMPYMKDGGEVTASIDKMIALGKQKDNRRMVEAGEFIRDFDLDSDTLIKAKYNEVKDYAKRALESVGSELRDQQFSKVEEERMDDIIQKEIDEAEKSGKWQERHNRMMTMTNAERKKRDIEVYKLSPDYLFVRDFQYTPDVIGNYISFTNKLEAGINKKLKNPEIIAWASDYLKRLKVFLPLAIKVEAMKDNIGKRKVLTEKEKAAKAAEEKTRQIYEMMPSINRNVLSQLIDEIKDSFVPVEKAIYQTEDKRYRKLIGEYSKKDKVKLKEINRDIPFAHDIFHSDIKGEMGKPASRYESQEVIWYFKILGKKENWEQALDENINDYIMSLRLELLFTIMENFRKITQPIKSYKLESLEVGYKGFEGTFRFDFKNGSHFGFYTHAIGAGGYNIQRYHFRYLSHFTDVVLSNGKKITNPSLYQIWENFSTEGSKMEEGGNTEGVKYDIRYMGEDKEYHTFKTVNDPEEAERIKNGLRGLNKYKDVHVQMALKNGGEVTSKKVCTLKHH